MINAQPFDRTNYTSPAVIVILAPIFTMIAFDIGRALGNLLLAGSLLYLLYQASKVTSEKSLRPSLPMYFYVALATWLVITSIITAPTLGTIKQVLSFIATSSIALLVLRFAQIENIPKQLRRHSTLLLLPIPIFAVKTIECRLNSECVPAIDFNGMVMTALLPIALYAIGIHSRIRKSVSIAIGSLCILLLLFADSRTELMMLLASFCIFFLFLKRKLLWLPVALLGALIFVLFVDLTIPAEHNLPPQAIDSVPEALELTPAELIRNLSNHRFEIWSQVLQNPPENLITGTGIKRTLTEIDLVWEVKHIHNIFLEVGYELGLPGVLIYSAWILVFFRFSLAVYRAVHTRERLLYAVVLASAGALLVGGILDKSYTSKIMSFLLPFFLGLLYYIGSQVNPTPLRAEKAVN
ncbi:MAG: O-antigen ligase family protein [Pseudomonadales bacterium]|nr:O-antigen ligase family protein [Pseudomonadales bacterium]